MLALTVSNGDVIIAIVALAVPVAALSFILGSGNAFKQIGRGPLSIDNDFPQGMRDTGLEAGGPMADEIRETEIRQMVEAKSYRRELRGDAPLDVDAEVARALEDRGSGGSGELARDAALVAEIRELVTARNARRERQGKEPLDVEAEVAKQLRELENLGQ